MRGLGCRLYGVANKTKSPQMIEHNVFKCKFVWRSIFVSACEGRMRESSSRKLVWVEGLGADGWEGCSECAWVFIPTHSPPVGVSLNEWMLTLDVQLSEQFAAHDCAKHPRAKAAKAG